MTVKKLSVAPGIETHGPSSGSVGSHFVHEYVNVIGNEPVHVPADAKRMSPSRGAVSPDGRLTTGGATFSGGLTDPASETTPVAADAEEGVEPATFDAVTTVRSVLPTSAETTAYVEAVAPPIAAQELPLASQRCQAYVNPLASAPLQPPFVVERSWPVCGAKPPVIDGGDTARGATVCQSGVVSPAVVVRGVGVPQAPPLPFVTSSIPARTGIEDAVAVRRPGRRGLVVRRARRDLSRSPAA